MQINDIRLLQCSFEQNTNYNISDVEIDVDININTNFDKEKNIIISVMTGSVHKKEEYPYSLEIAVGGAFFVEENEVTNIDKICDIDVHKILFLYLRDSIADITRRGGHPQLLLPYNPPMKG